MGLREICPYCGSKYSAFLQNRCPNCDNIDFENIDMIHLSDVEQAYRTETEEEFDIVATNFLTALDGWQHYETQTVEYEVPDGENYTFVIIYEDGSHEERKYHCSSPFTEKLLNHKKFFDIEEELEDVLEEVRKAAGKYKGKPPMKIDKELFEKLYGEVKRKERTATYAMKQMGVKRTTWYVLVNEYETRTGRFK